MPEGLEQHRPALLLLARAQLARHPRLNFDASDLVQEALLKGDRDAAQFRGGTEQERFAWLRKILHLGEHQGLPFYAMELIEGCSLADRLRQGDVTKEAVVRYLASVAEAVQEVHDRGFLHRDVKPANILIDQRTDQALLTDFGLAMIASPDRAEQSVREQAAVAGTLPYMSPEQTQGAEHVTERSDVYSLGATLYEALAGSPPFTDTSRNKLLVSIRDAEPEPPRRRRPDLSPELERICLRCLRKDPARRFASAGELAEALRTFTRNVRYVRNFTALGTLTLVIGPLGMLLDVMIYWMLQGSFSEPLVWAMIFAHYLKLGPVLLLTAQRSGNLEGGNWREPWAVWGGHAAALVTIAVALRTGLDVPPREVILLTYSVLAGPSGMAYFVEASKMPWRRSWGPVGFWLIGVVMLFHREMAPLYYGGYVALGSVAYGLYLRRLGKQLG